MDPNSKEGYTVIGGNGVNAKISEKQKPLWDKIGSVQDEVHGVALQQAKMETNIETLVITVAEMRDLMNQQYVTKEEVRLLRETADVKYVTNGRLLAICGATFLVGATGLVAFIIDKLAGG